MADLAPDWRASYDAVDTTPRGPVPPTSTGRPRSDGLSRCSTAAKNESASACSTVARVRRRSTTGLLCPTRRPAAGDGRARPGHDGSVDRVVGGITAHTIP